MLCAVFFGFTGDGKCLMREYGAWGAFFAVLDAFSPFRRDLLHKMHYKPKRALFSVSFDRKSEFYDLRGLAKGRNSSNCILHIENLGVTIVLVVHSAKIWIGVKH